jgi:hypothetical protein
MSEFDASAIANRIANDLEFVWITRLRHNWQKTPDLMLDKVRKDIAALTDEERIEILTRLAGYGAVEVKNAKQETVALSFRGGWVSVPLC